MHSVYPGPFELRVRSFPSGGAWTVWPPVVLSGAAFIPLLMLGGFFPVIQDDLGTSAGFLGFVVSLFYLSSTVGFAVCSLIIDSIPAHVAVRSGIVVIALATSLIGWSGQSAILLVPAVIAAGMGHSLVQTAGNTWLARSALRPALMFGVKQSSASAAGVVVGLLVALAPRAEWRTLFVVVGVTIGVGAVLIRRPAEGRMPTLSAFGPGVAPSPVTLWPSAIVALVGAGVALTTASYFAASVVDLDFDVSFAGQVIFAASLVCVISRLVIGRILDGSPGFARGACSATWAMGAVGFSLLALREASGPLIVAAAVLAYGIGWAWTGALLYTVTREFPRSPGRVTGVIQTAAAIGGMVGPLVAGQGIERWGYQPLWVICAVLTVFSAALVVIRPRASGQLLPAG